MNEVVLIKFFHQPLLSQNFHVIAVAKSIDLQVGSRHSWTPWFPVLWDMIPFIHLSSRASLGRFKPKGRDPIPEGHGIGVVEAAADPYTDCKVQEEVRVQVGIFIFGFEGYLGWTFGDVFMHAGSGCIEFVLLYFGRPVGFLLWHSGQYAFGHLNLELGRVFFIATMWNAEMNPKVSPFCSCRGIERDVARDYPRTASCSKQG
mmetsp:Transcript_3181/g.19677  ORF Transcript_3181/g.19677 Transcript_3181/m.19677 type:complete len:203 (+) Transcript_3181:390-998(+)